jgi:hypothetical protein
MPISGRSFVSVSAMTIQTVSSLSVLSSMAVTRLETVSIQSAKFWIGRLVNGCHAWWSETSQR